MRSRETKGVFSSAVMIVPMNTYWAANWSDQPGAFPQLRADADHSTHRARLAVKGDEFPASHFVTSAITTGREDDHVRHTDARRSSARMTSGTTSCPTRHRIATPGPTRGLWLQPHGVPALPTRRPTWPTRSMVRARPFSSARASWTTMPTSRKLWWGPACSLTPSRSLPRVTVPAGYYYWARQMNGIEGRSAPFSTTMRDKLHGWRSTWSRHFGSANLLFGDGRVQFVKETPSISLPGE